MARKTKQTSGVNEASAIIEQAAAEAQQEAAQAPKQLTPQEQIEAMRLYVQSMEKVQGHTNEDVRNIIHSVHKRFILLLNYSGIDDKLVKPLKTQLANIVEEEQERYKDE